LIIKVHIVLFHFIISTGSCVAYYRSVATWTYGVSDFYFF
jgi:hypothetical protein